MWRQVGERLAGEIGECKETAGKLEAVLQQENEARRREAEELAERMEREKQELQDYIDSDSQKLRDKLDRESAEMAAKLEREVSFA